MSFYQRRVLPYLLHFAMRQETLMPFRKRVIAAAEGRVLEIGVCSGLNLPLYGPAVRSVVCAGALGTVVGNGASARCGCIRPGRVSGGFGRGGAD